MKEDNYCLMYITLFLVFFFMFSLIPLVVIGVAMDGFTLFMVFGYSFGMAIIIMEFLVEEIEDFINELKKGE